MKYFDELKKSMNYLAVNEKTIFIGQAVEVPGTAMTNTLKGINPKKLLELPVAEEMQMGITTGLALDGNIPVSIFPRWNFVLLAMNQLINHLDKVNIMSNNGFKTKAIIRVNNKMFFIFMLANGHIYFNIGCVNIISVLFQQSNI